MNRIPSSIITAFFIFVFFYLFAKIFGPIPFSIDSVTTTKTDLFTVQGVGEATGTPDTAMISVGVTKEATTVEQAQNQVNTIATKITDDIKKLGVDVKDIKTTNYNVSPNYDYTSGKQTENGFIVSENLEIKLKPVEKANLAIDAATKDGANVVGGITFVLDDVAQQKLEDQARKQAIQKAKTKAQSIANSAGIRLGRIVNIQEDNGVQNPIPYTAKMSAEGLGGGVPTQLSPGQNTVNSTVTLSYETL